MIYYAGKFPYLVRMRAEVWPLESKWRGSHPSQTRNFHFSMAGKHVVYRPKVIWGPKCSFLVRLSVWH